MRMTLSALLLALFAISGIAGQTTVAINGKVTAGAVATPKAWPVLITLGDSLTHGTGPEAWPARIAELLPDSAASVFNVAENGRDTVAVLAGFTDEVTPHLPTTTGVPGALATVLVGVNDFSVRDGAATYANVKTIWAQLRAGGAKVIAFKIAPETVNPEGSDWDNRRLAFNTLVDSDPTLFDLLLWQTEVMPNPSNAYFYSDGTHFTEEGAKTFARYIYARVNKGAILP